MTDTDLQPTDVITAAFGGGDTGNGDTPARTALAEFETEDVLAARLRIRGAGTGLSGALDLAPVVHHRGDTIHVLLELKVEQIHFAPLKDVEGAVARVHDCVTVAGTIVEDGKGARMLASTKKAIAKAAEEAAGVQQLPGVDEDE